VRKSVIIAVLVAMMTAAYAQMQPVMPILHGNTAAFTGINTGNIEINSHKNLIHKKQNHKNTPKSGVLSVFAAEEEGNDDALIHAAVMEQVVTASDGPAYPGIVHSAVYKEKANLTILKTRK
jgi:hypothetical protein